MSYMNSLKKLAQKYYKEMSSDSKSKSAEAECKLCKILNYVIDRMKRIENAVGYSVRDYPDRIKSIDYEENYKYLPDVLECYPSPDYEWMFRFETSWLNLDFEAYFNELKEKSIARKQYTIEKVEQSLQKHKDELKVVIESKYPFSDVCNIDLQLEEE